MISTARNYFLITLLIFKENNLILSHQRNRIVCSLFGN